MSSNSFRDNIFLASQKFLDFFFLAIRIEVMKIEGHQAERKAVSGSRWATHGSIRLLNEWGLLGPIGGLNLCTKASSK